VIEWVYLSSGAGSLLFSPSPLSSLSPPSPPCLFSSPPPPRVFPLLRMSHQTGIKANESLKKFFGKCRTGKVRVMKITIENEELSLSSYKEGKGNWEEDFDRLVTPLALPGQPTYIMYRFDTKNQCGGYEWLLISWSPDDSPVRQKMLYASTKATLKQEFGSGQIKEEIHASTPDEVCLAGVLRKRDSGPAPLSPREEELSEITAGLRNAGFDTKVQTLSSLSMPLTENALKGVLNLVNRKVNYLRLSIDIPAEKILLDMEGIVGPEELPSKVPEDSAKYHLFRFIYTHEEKPSEALLFVYSMPGYSCPIKERMLYSSCKGPLLETLEHQLGAKIDKKLEVDSGKEVSFGALYEALHPKMTLPRPRFEKPKGPPNRGAKRITKSQQ